MPETTYTRTGPEQDAAGRLADFARFAVDELDEIRQRLNAPGTHELGSPVRRADFHADHALLELGAVADLLSGYTTAAESTSRATRTGGMVAGELMRELRGDDAA